MTDPRSYVRLRSVGRLEKHATARHSLGFYNNVGASAFYSSSSSLQLQDFQLLIYRALDAVICEHPALGAVVVDEDKSAPYFVLLPTVKLQDAVEFVAATTALDPNSTAGVEDLDEILEQQHNRNFRERLGEVPYWRLIVICEPNNTSKFVACFVYHHAIADGTSGLSFHRSFLSKLSCLADFPGSSPIKAESLGSRDGPISILPEKPILPSLESLHPLPLSVSYILRSAWHEYFTRSTSELWTAAAITDATSMQRSRFRSIQFSLSTTSQLLTACRSNSTTVTATVESMLAAALFYKLPSDQYSVLRCGGALSLRRWLPRETVNDDSIGNWVSRYVEEHRRPPGLNWKTANAMELFSWEDAQRVKATIKSELDREGKDSVVGLLRFAGDLHSYFTKKIGKLREESFELSNIGVFKSNQDAQKDGNWKIGRVVFSQSADVVGAAFETSLVTGGDGCLNIGFSWLEGIVDGDWMEQVIDTLKHLVEDVVQRT